MFHSSEFDNAWSLSASPQDISPIADDPIVIAIRHLLSGQAGLEQALQGLDFSSRVGEHHSRFQ
jgi:hypothetical protein